MPQGMDFVVGYQTPVVATTTWNPSNKHANVILTNGNLTVGTTTTGGPFSVRSVSQILSGKRYFEVTCPATMGSGYIFGFLDVTGSGLSSWFAQNLAGVGWQNNNGSVFFNGANLGTIATYTSNDVIGLALDMDNKKAWFRVGSGGWNNDVIGNQNPATNTGGANLATMSVTASGWAAAGGGAVAGETTVTNFGASAYAQTPPAGFSNWV